MIGADEFEILPGRVLLENARSLKEKGGEAVFFIWFFKYVKKSPSFGRRFYK